LWAERHLIGVAESVLIEEGELIPRSGFVSGETGWLRLAGEKRGVKIGWNLKQIRWPRTKIGLG
jgi:hypothetical protein